MKNKFIIKTPRNSREPARQYIANKKQIQTLNTAG